MDIVLLAKFVPDIDRIPPDAWDQERGTLIRSRLEMAFNPLDRVALRMALAIKARRPGTRIIALSMGPPGATAMLKEAIAYGADGAVLLTDTRFAGADTIATAYTLSCAIRQMVSGRLIGADFAALCGMQSPDGDTAQVPAQVAAFLDAPLYPYVCELEADGEKIELKCLNSVGFQRVVTGRRPFVVTATRLYPDLPFYVDLAAMRRANDTEVVVWGREAVELDERRIGLDGSRTRVIKMFEPERRHAAGEPLIAGDEDFPARAARLLGGLRTSFGGSEEARDDEPVEPDAAAGEGYYGGDCVALCELAEGRLAPVSFEITSACARMARKLGCDAAAVVCGPRDADIAEELEICGAANVWFVEGIGTDVFRVRERARAITALLRELRPQIVVAPATLTGRVVAPYVSAQLDCGLTADCSALEVAEFERRGETLENILYQTRPALGGNVMATIVSVYDDPRSGRPQMATVRPGALVVRKLPAESCTVNVFRAPEPSDGFGDRITAERQAEEEKHIDLQDFEVIVTAGMGVGDRETVGRLVEPFRAALERYLGVPVGLGCSRAMVDAGVLAHAHQVGQTGVVVKPKIYFGVGVSGAIQHKIGMENSRTIVSINRDPAAPMHGFADHVIVGDIEQALPVLVAAMGQPAEGARE